jgi:hypothetical protein
MASAAQRWATKALDSSLGARSVRVLVRPSPITFSERRAVLEVLQNHGPIEMFRMTPVCSWIESISCIYEEPIVDETYRVRVTTVASSPSPRARRQRASFLRPVRLPTRSTPIAQPSQSLRKCCPRPAEAANSQRSLDQTAVSKSTSRWRSSQHKITIMRRHSRECQSTARGRLRIPARHRSWPPFSRRRCPMMLPRRASRDGIITLWILNRRNPPTGVIAS